MGLMPVNVRSKIRDITIFKLNTKQLLEPWKLLTNTNLCIQPLYKKNVKLSNMFILIPLKINNTITQCSYAHFLMPLRDV